MSTFYKISTKVKISILVQDKVDGHLKGGLGKGKTTRVKLMQRCNLTKQGEGVGDLEFENGHSGAHAQLREKLGHNSNDVTKRIETKLNEVGVKHEGVQIRLI